MSDEHDPWREIIINQDAEIERLTHELKVEKALGGLQGHESPCYYCGDKCNSLSAMPSRWPIPLAHGDDPGRVKWHHIGCVMSRVDNVDEAKAEIERLKTVIRGRDLNDEALEAACLAALEANCDPQYRKRFEAILSNLEQTKEREREVAKR